MSARANLTPAVKRAGKIVLAAIDDMVAHDKREAAERARPSPGGESPANADGDGNEPGEERGASREQERIESALPKERRHGNTVGERESPIAAKDPLDPEAVPRGKRSVEPVARA